MKKKKQTQQVDQPGVDRPIQLADIESGLRSLKTDFTTVKNSAAGAGIAAGIAGALLLVALAFILGRARGNKKYAFVEVRRA
jgi:fatty acid/phospholipid biosynthesis enzyme